MDPRERIDASSIPGNTPQLVLRQSLVDPISNEARVNEARGTHEFVPEITSRFAWTGIYVAPKEEKLVQLEGRVVGEITVQEGAVVAELVAHMLNGRGTLIHSACSTLLIDKYILMLFLVSADDLPCM